MAGGQWSPGESHPGTSLHESWGTYDKAMPALMGGCPGSYTHTHSSLHSCLHLLQHAIWLPHLSSSETVTWRNALVRAGHRVSKGMKSLPPHPSSGPLLFLHLFVSMTASGNEMSTSEHWQGRSTGVERQRLQTEGWSDLTDSRCGCFLRLYSYHSFLQPGEGRCLRDASTLPSSVYRTCQKPTSLHTSDHTSFVLSAWLVGTALEPWSLCHSLLSFFILPDE